MKPLFSSQITDSEEHNITFKEKKQNQQNIKRTKAKFQ